MNSFYEADVPSTHYQPVSGELVPIPASILPTQENITMDQITQNQNPFSINKEEEQMKLTIKHNNGEIFEYDLALLAKPVEEMSNMDYVLAWIKAVEVETVIRTNTNVIMNVGQLGMEAPRTETLIDIDDSVLDAKLLVDKFFKNELTEETNYNPHYVYSFRVFKGKIGLKKNQAQIFEMLVRDVSDQSDDDTKKHRLMIYFNSYTANSAGSHYKKKWPYALMINRTKNGLRVMWVKVNGKKGREFIFGTPYGAMAKQKLVPEILEQEVYYYLTLSTKVGDWLPIMKFMNNKYYQKHNASSIHPFGITMSNIYWIGGSTDIKAIINKAYGKSGVQGVTKHMFGGRNTIDTMEKMQLAIWFARVLRDFPATVFNNIPLIQNNQIFTNGKIEDYHRFFKLFGTKEHYIEQMNAEIRVTELDEYEIGYCPDTVRMFKDIRSKQHRTAIINHVKNHVMSFRDVHDYINAELAKIKRENKEVKKTLFTNKFLKHQGAWISDGIQIVVPTESHELIEWGAIQNNCIGSYGYSVANGTTMIVGFRDIHQEWIGHALISEHMKLEQLLGKHNSHLEDNEKNIIVEYLNKEIGININSYWGS
jgi:hypothetical protein